MIKRLELERGEADTITKNIWIDLWIGTVSSDIGQMQDKGLRPKYQLSWHGKGGRRTCFCAI